MTATPGPESGLDQPARWHVPEPDLQGYAAGRVSAATALSVEAHLLDCPVCRARLAPLVPTAPLQAVWARIEDAVQVPTVPMWARVLRRVGLPASDTMLLAAAPSLRSAWALATVLALAYPVFAAGWSVDRSVLAFLLVAPLAPIAGVAFAYGPDVDPTYELALAAPYSPVRLLLIRTAAVLGFCLPLAALAGALVPGPWWLAVAWLMPAAAAVVTILAASTWTSPARAALVVATGWTAAVMLTAIAATPLALVNLPALLLYAAVLGAGALLFRNRAHLLAQMEEPR